MKKSTADPSPAAGGGEGGHKDVQSDTEGLAQRTIIIGPRDEETEGGIPVEIWHSLALQQRDVARQFQQQRDRADQMQAKALALAEELARERQSYSGEVASLKTQLEQLKQDNEARCNENASLIAVNEHLQEKNMELQTEIKDLEKTIGELEAKNSFLEGRVDSLEDEVRNLGDNMKKLLSEKCDRDHTLSARQIAINLESALMQFIWPFCRRGPFYLFNLSTLSSFLGDIQNDKVDDKVRSLPFCVFVCPIPARVSRSIK